MNMLIYGVIYILKWTLKCMRRREGVTTRSDDFNAYEREITLSHKKISYERERNIKQYLSYIIELLPKEIFIYTSLRQHNRHT